MPKYRKKITRRTEYAEILETFRKREDTIRALSIMEKAYIIFLFFAGCRVTESISITSDDITFTPDTIYIQIHRLKGSKQTDPLELPNQGVLTWITEQEGTIFPFSRFTAYRIIKKIFPDLYPHYFRLNRITKTAEKFSDSTVYNLFGISATSIDHYRGKTDIKRVGVSLREEMKE